MAETDNSMMIAFVLSLIGGILILLSGIIILTFGAAFMGGMMGGYYPGMMGGYRGFGGAVTSVLLVMGIGGIVIGAIMILGSFMLRTRPETHTTWGIVILILSIVSFIEGGGFFIGAILGIVGGILAMVWKPEEPAKTPAA